MPDIDLGQNTKQKYYNVNRTFRKKKGAVQDNNKGSYNEIM